ncbi:telomerase reverse transcriptase [Saccharomycopsis crataegensis]|uniref:Telomerase reverse transcriptase n=1 Tax=Saccharomycopsis crataegensis TaxID=43959 RepID=A0AAV5QU46_9ASCO|nr:telomerase reverse transcriptase [Saccharomycopsis crataegensis]
MYTLRKHFANCSNLTSYTDPQWYLDLLDSVIVEQCASKPSAITYHSLFLDEVTFEEFLNNCVEFILKNRLPNIVANGLGIAGQGGYSHRPASVYNHNHPVRFDHRFHSQSMVKFTLGGKSSSFQYQFLKNDAWKLLFERIGPHKLGNLIIYHRGYLKHQDNNYLVQLFGKKKQQQQKNSYVARWMENFTKNQVSGQFSTVDRQKIKSTTKMISNKAMFNNRTPCPKYRISMLLPENPQSLMVEIFKLSKDYASSKRLRGKYGKIYQLLLMVVDNHHSKRKHHYQTLLEKYTVPANHQDKKVFSKSVAPQQVGKFVIQMISMLFPIEVFGNSKNRGVVYQQITIFITMIRKQEFPIDRVMQGIKIKEIAWLGKPHPKLAKQDLTKRTMMFSQFLHWLFDSFIVGLIGGYFHVTNMTSDIATYHFFHHKDWNLLQAEFINEYSQQFLGDPQPIGPKHKNYLFGKVGVFPKPNDLRLLCFPIRGKTRQEIISYRSRLKQTVKPVRYVLRYLRTQRLLGNDNKVVTCTDNMVRAIQNFASHHPNHRIFYKKFDIKSCYDVLPRDKIYEIIDDLVDEGDIFIYDQVSDRVRVFNVEAGNPHENYKLVNQQIVNSLAKENNDPITKLIEQLKIKESRKISDKKDKKKFHYLVDEASTKYQIVKKQQIMELVKDQLFRSALKVGNTYICRKRGIFQGFNFSAIFCDIFFDHLLFKELGIEYNSKDTLIIRFADDFLILSVNQKAISQVFFQISTALKQYDVKVNESKTLSNLAKSNLTKLSNGPASIGNELITSTPLDNKDLKIVVNSNVFGNNNIVAGDNLAADNDFAETNITFCGLNINTQSWGIIRDFKVPKSLVHTAPSKIYSHALWLYEIRLSELLLAQCPRGMDNNKNKKTTTTNNNNNNNNHHHHFISANISINCEILLTFIIASHRRSCGRSSSLVVGQFAKWYRKFQKFTFLRLRKVNRGKIKVKELYDLSVEGVVKGFMKVLQRQPVAFREMIGYLNGELKRINMGC